MESQDTYLLKNQITPLHIRHAKLTLLIEINYYKSECKGNTF